MDSSSFTQKEKEFMIGALTLTFKEFMYGYGRLVSFAKNSKSTQVKILFYSNAVNKYIADYFLINDPIVFKTLDKVGLSSLGDPIRKLLKEPVGKTTYGETVRKIRNKALIHEGYSSIEIHKIFIDANLYSLQGNFQLAQKNKQMFKEIKKLHSELMKYLPKNRGY